MMSLDKTCRATQSLAECIGLASHRETAAADSGISEWQKISAEHACWEGVDTFAPLTVEFSRIESNLLDRFACAP